MAISKNMSRKGQKREKFPAAPGTQPPAPAVPPGDPLPGWTIQDYERCIATAVQTIRHHEESGFVTAAYWRLDRSLRRVEADHLYPSGVSFRQWCSDQGVTDDYRSRAKGISDA